MLSIGDKYDVYSPYYDNDKEPVTSLIFPSDRRDQVIITDAYNGQERAHTDRMYLSDITEAVATKHAGRPLSSINTIVARTVVNPQTREVINDYYSDWKRDQSNPRAQFPEKVTVDQSDRHWSAFGNTPFFKSANHVFQDSGSSVGSVDLVSKYGDDLWFHRR
ncbi:hypothetical protein LX32DRAFT_729904 [Colletotrichum zoysiae]|uniref:Uncharacterized protein n=1 Tax=Colletotrichum zoysiae TaxID=1216348 RepID=A0AAD9LY60_9PEZI|nr:hypothetical protein LX32DRAFT_729904 [Colletotrichum zoysiae]